MKNEKCSVNVGFNVWLLNYQRPDTNLSVSQVYLVSLYPILLRVPGFLFAL